MAAWQLSAGPSVSCLAASQPGHTPLLQIPGPCSSPVLADLPASEGGSQGEGTLPLSQLPPRGAGPILIPFFSLSFRPTRLCGDLSCSFGCMRSFDSFQLVFCENRSRCSCIFLCICSGEVSSMSYSATLVSLPRSLFEISKCLPC